MAIGYFPVSLVLWLCQGMNFTLALPPLKNLSFLLSLSRSLAEPRNEFLEALRPLKNDEARKTEMRFQVIPGNENFFFFLLPSSFFLLPSSFFLLPSS
ncbi:MAG: hypothetical protein M3N42_16465 [Cyanobacteriota bacterium]|nr:hypothetical protein [Cyanobacteriota bacterium]